MYRTIVKSLAVCSVVAVVALTIPASVSASSKDSVKPAETCTQKVAKLNYRSELLEILQKSDNAKYSAVRDKWVTRISYAGQWVPKDAEKTREALYEYDALHAATDKELTKQMNDYRYLEKSPLSCSKTKLTTLTKKLDEVRGYKNKKIVGGNALISEYKQKEAEFLKKDFKKSSDKLIDKLHAKKRKHPAPEHPRTSVK